MLILGSKSDLEVCEQATKVLDKLGISYEVIISSAHRTPDRTAEIAKNLEANGIKVAICMAGYAAHLPGVVSAFTNIPVIGVPLAGSPLNGMDALLSQQMPGGIPVACMTIGAAGAVNAAVFAGRIIALSDPAVKANLEKYVADMRAKAMGQA